MEDTFLLSGIQDSRNYFGLYKINLPAFLGHANVQNIENEDYKNRNVNIKDELLGFPFYSPGSIAEYKNQTYT